MKFLIGDKMYEAASLHDATLNEHMLMKRTTSLSCRDVEERLHELSQEPFTSDPEAVFESDRHLMAYGAIVWLARWRAGERLTFEEACDFSLAEFFVIPDETDVVPDPPRARKRAAKKTPGSPARKAAQPPSRPAARKSNTPKTSKRTSKRT